MKLHESSKNVRLFVKKSLTSTYLLLYKGIIPMYKNLVLMLVVLLLSSCGLFGSYYEPETVGIGKGSDELKLSPCACMQIELINELPDWFTEII